MTVCEEAFRYIIFRLLYFILRGFLISRGGQIWNFVHIWYGVWTVGLHLFKKLWNSFFAFQSSIHVIFWIVCRQVWRRCAFDWFFQHICRHWIIQIFNYDVMHVIVNIKSFEGWLGKSRKLNSQFLTCAAWKHVQHVSIFEEERSV